MSDFQNDIYTWFLSNKRDLPWRKTKDPYKIWLSEIILQQTRVVQGIGYYQQFVTHFPTVNILASATEDEVLKLWQGLGYYSRARNLHFSAKIIVNQFSGNFPNEYKKILKLKGIGLYTAAAISSIAFNLPHPTVDGNIYRVLSRYFGIETPIDSNRGKKEFYELAEELLLHQNPGMHNQAFMEFGALQCVPKSPKCNLCPIAQTCFALKNHLIEQLPVKSKKIKQTKRYFYYYYIESGEFTFFEKRTNNDIWKNLYQFPLIESKESLPENDILRNEIPFLINNAINIKSISAEKKHILSHQIIYARLIHIEIEKAENISNEIIRINKKDIHKFAVPKLLEQFINDLNIG
ncbi:MAG: A/G-specific adenine glycosylase [Bacteroidetes bacterium]|nr:A/G-specific adenine glycosylase [Bacteroidota bacterium]